MEDFDKILEKFRFKQYDSFDVSKIKKIITEIPDSDWLKDTSRQDVYATHRDTQSYFLYKTDLKWKLGTEYSCKLDSDNETLLDLAEPIIEYLEKLHNGKRGNVLFIKLPAKMSIPKHHDDGDYLMVSRRHHIPILTNQKTTFGVVNEKINMKQGECWEINNAKRHYVDNDGNTDRIHLLIDIMPNEFIVE